MLFTSAIINAFQLSLIHQPNQKVNCIGFSGILKFNLQQFSDSRLHFLIGLQCQKRYVLSLALALLDVRRDGKIQDQGLLGDG